MCVAHEVRLRFLFTDAEDMREPDAHYDWHRVLKPGRVLLFFDGDWARIEPPFVMEADPERWTRNLTTSMQP